MIQFVRYIYVEASKKIAKDAEEQTIAALKNAKLVSEKFDPIGKLASYCDEMQLRNPRLEIRSQKTEIWDTFLEGKSRHRCPRCQKLMPTSGPTMYDPMSGQSFVVPLIVCASCGMNVDETWVESDELVVFKSSFFVALSADNFIVARPTLKEDVPEFLACISNAIHAPVKEVFVARESG